MPIALCFLLVVFALLPPGTSLAAEAPLARDLAADGARARREGLPIVMMFSARSCPYCRTVKDLYIEPMAADAEYARKAIIRVVELEDALDLRDFQGRKVSHAEFARRYGVTLVPTVKFLDADGAEIAPEVRGLITLDYYAGFLDTGIEAALARMRGKSVSDPTAK